MRKKKEVLDKAKESWKKIIKWWKKWTKKVIWWTAKAIWYTIRLINAWDKTIWDEIEKRRPWKVWKFLRTNLIKLMIALSALGYWWYRAIETPWDKQENQQELVNKWEDITDLFTQSDVIKDLKSSGKDWQDKRETRYLWKDDAWNKMRNGFWYAERKKVIEWMCRMVESWDLEMVLKKADNAWVPRQCVFLALAESWWQAWADSWVAWWYRQFTEDSAKLFGLIDSEWNDYRSDPEKSTDAAMRHLQENYKIVCKIGKDNWFNMSESDKWIFAFHMYNWSPNLVKKWMIACEWNANEYPEKQKNKENRNYVPRILAIQDALHIIFKENWYDVQKVREKHLDQTNTKKTEADLMYEEFIKDENTMSKEDKTKKLNEIGLKYEEEYKAWLISEVYYKWAIRVIEEEKDMDDE